MRRFTLAACAELLTLSTLLLGGCGKAEEAPGLDVSGLDMQKLFIRLTNV